MLTPFGQLPNRLAAELTMAEQHEWLQRQVPRRALLRGAGVLAATSGMLWARPDRAFADANSIYGRHLAFGPDPTTDAIVGFASRIPVRRASVHLDDGREEEAEIHTVPGSGRFYLRARFSQLRPSTEYTYALQVEDAPVAGGQFRTAPAGPARFRFTAFGDQNVDSAAVQVLGQVSRARPLLHLLAGDMCYADSSGAGGPGDAFHSRQWDYWLRQNEPVASRLPWMVVPGNHEMEPGFGTHGYAGWLTRVAVGGASPLGVPVASAFRVGSVGFVGLDSNDVSDEIPANRGWTGSRQTAWLEQQLAAYRRSHEIDFVVAFMHASPYCTSPAHGSDGGIRNQWVPLFDKYSVDLVISGHNHCYQRALPLRRGAIVTRNAAEVDGAAATTYVTVGGGGAGLNTSVGNEPTVARVATASGPQPEQAPWAAAPHALDYCVLVADVEPSGPGSPARMRLRVLTGAGATIDQWQIFRHRRSAGNDGSWLWPDGAAAFAGLGAVGAVGAAVTLRHRVRTPAAPPDGGA